jgi:hypothetical protein
MIRNSYSVCILFYLEVGDVRQAQDQPRPPAPHDVASQRIDTDRFRADARSEADLGGGNVAVHSGPIEEQPGASDLKGGWLMFN